MQSTIRDALRRFNELSRRLKGAGSQENDQFTTVSQQFCQSVAESGGVELRVSTNAITFDDLEVYRSESRTQNLAFDLFRQNVRLLRFRPGLSEDEIGTFWSTFSRFVQSETLDEDLSTTLWREDLAHLDVITIDRFTEKVFMADPEFMQRFRGTIDDVLPGFTTYEPLKDESIEGHWDAILQRSILDEADLIERKLRRALAENTVGDFCQGLSVGDDVRPFVDRMLRRLSAFVVHSDCPLQDAEISGIINCLFGVYVNQGAWQSLAVAMRSLFELGQHRQGAPTYTAHRLAKLAQIATGRDLLELVTARLPGHETDFVTWLRWHFLENSTLTAPQLLELVNLCQNSVGKELIKSLLRQQGSSSMDAWAERLQDPNPKVVEEVINVIVESELGEQAKPLFLTTLEHPGATVRALSVEVLTPFYDANVRQVILPLITDPDERVRLAILKLALATRDKSLGPYLMQVSQSNECYSYGEDELRTLYETTALLGVESSLRTLFEERLALESEQGLLGKFFKSGTNRVSDSPMRRAAISGLATLGDPHSLSIVKRVHQRAELSLAAHCDVAVKMGARLRTHNPENSVQVETSNGRELLLDGADRMGSRLLFDASDFGINYSRLSNEVVVDEGTVAGQPPAGGDSESPSIVETSVPAEHGLYFHGKVVSEPERIYGVPSLLESEPFRVIDLQLSLVPLQEKKAQNMALPKPSQIRVIEKQRSRPPSLPRQPRQETAESGSGDIDDLLQSYVDSESPAKPVSVDEILEGYLGNSDVKAQSAPSTQSGHEGDLESLLIDYAAEDKKGDT